MKRVSRAVIALVFLLLTGGARSEDVVVFRLTGSGLQTIRPFFVEGPWEVQWSSEGSMHIFVHTETGDLVGIVANQLGKGTGSSYQAKAGRYFLSIDGAQQWTVTVVRVK